MRVAIVSPRKIALTETFIKSHFDFLKGEIVHYYGGDFPTEVNDKALFKQQTLISKVIQKLRERVFQNSLNYRERALYKSLLEQRVDVILIQYGNIAAEILKVLEKTKIPFVVHFHGFDSSVRSVLTQHERSYRRIFDSAYRIIAVSTVMKRELIRLGAKEEKVSYVCYGPYPEFAELMPNYSEKNLLFVGRFVDKKAPHLTILSFAKIVNKHPEARLWLIGSGPLRRFCQEMVSSLELQNSVIFLGDQAPSDVRQYMEKARCLVQHSREAENGDSEGTPLSILEAQLAALPVVSTVHAGIQDVVQHGKTGYLVEEGDVVGMAKYLDIILSDVDLARDLGRAGRERITEEFSMQKYIGRLQKILDDAAVSR
jgi:colanic acid/amylovoran biosynthesis glycosyltransferase